MYKCQEILQKKVSELASRIKREIKFDLKSLMYRDYMVKLEALNSFQDSLMIFNLYYSPKKDTFRIVVEMEKDMLVASYIKGLFEGNTVQKGSEGVSTPLKTSYIAYTDGSFLNGRVGYGAVLLHDKKIVERFSGIVEGGDSFRQVTGELEAVLRVVRFCERKAIHNLIIRFDYTGVRDWAIDAWAAKNELTKHYKKEIQATSVNIVWEKVDAHSGDYYNDMADELAKAGASSF